MPIRQPVQTTIHTDDFRDKTYGFAVESVINPQERVGMLTVSTSVGYLLTTSLNKDPKREQTFEHIQQTDGSWLAKGTVTVLAMGESPVNGTIIIRNSLAETVVLTIGVTSTSLELAQSTTLTVNQPTLAFARTSPGKPSFLVLTVAEQRTDEPVTLTTDAPEYFQLASDSRPAFLPALTLMPASTGTYVHIRYFASKNGTHTGHLTLHNRYESQTVTLKGRSSGLLPTLRQSGPAVGPATRGRPQKLLVAKRWTGLLALVIAGGLAYAGYTNRCQFFPALCQATETGQTSTQDNLPLSSVADNTSAEVALTAEVPKGVKFQKVMLPKPYSQPGKAARMALANPLAKQAVPGLPNKEHGVLTHEKSSKQITENQVDSQTQRRIAPASPTEESDLEREINQNL